MKGSHLQREGGGGNKHPCLQGTIVDVHLEVKYCDSFPYTQRSVCPHFPSLHFHGLAPLFLVSVELIFSRRSMICILRFCLLYLLIISDFWTARYEWQHSENFLCWWAEEDTPSQVALNIASLIKSAVAPWFLVLWLPKELRLQAATSLQEKITDAWPLLYNFVHQTKFLPFYLFFFSLTKQWCCG